LSSSCLLIAEFQPFNQTDISQKLKETNFQALSLDMIPRTTLAQSMDVLSSMASISGYKAVLEAARLLPRYFPMMITAAGSIRPAKVLVLGAGVAGLQSIATARRLGAMVEAFDTRSAAKEEVKSLGAKFIEIEGATEDTGAGGYAVAQSEDFLKRQREEVQLRASKSDIIITTAQVRGRKAPLLVPTSTVEKMKKGSVIIDLAASTGGNCELTKNNELVNHNGVFIYGDSNLASKMPQDASQLYSTNLLNFIKLFIKEGNLQLDLENEIIKSALITKDAQ
jgi:NAD(P) transhydrogenase subunit alpha